MPQLLLRAIITGFGYKLGTELGRYVIARFGRKKPAEPPAPADADLPEGMPADPARPGEPARKDAAEGVSPRARREPGPSTLAS